MRKHLPVLVAGACMLLATPVTAFPQEEEEEPEFHFLTVPTFDLPGGEEREKAFVWIDSIMVPLTQLNPNVLWSRVATHNWGSNSAQVALVAEYPDWASIEADCEPCDAWFEEMQPEEGTPEREEWDAMAQNLFKYFIGHHDEIYIMNMNRAK